MIISALILCQSWNMLYYAVQAYRIADDKKDKETSFVLVLLFLSFVFFGAANLILYFLSILNFVGTHLIASYRSIIMQILILASAVTFRRILFHDSKKEDK